MKQRGPTADTEYGEESVTTGETEKFLGYLEAARRPTDARLAPSTFPLWSEGAPVYCAIGDEALYLQPARDWDGPPAAFAIGIADVEEVALQEFSRVTIARVLVLFLLGILPAVLAPLWKKKEERLTIDFICQGKSVSIALEGEPRRVGPLHDALRLKIRDLHRGVSRERRRPKHWTRH